MSVSQLQIGTFQHFVISLGRVVVGFDRLKDQQRAARPVAITTSISAQRIAISSYYTCDKLPWLLVTV
jgi:hypothetical protein